MGRVAREVVRRMCEVTPDQMHLGLTFENHLDTRYGQASKCDPLFDEISNLRRLDVSEYYGIPTPYNSRLARREASTISLFEHLKDIGAGAYWDLTPFIGEAFVPVFNMPVVGIIYDAIPYIYKKYYRYNAQLEREFAEQVACLRHYNHLISISDATKDDFVLQFGMDAERITTVYPKLGRLFYEAAKHKRSVKPKKPDDQIYAICVSSHHHTKNLPSLCKAWRQSVSMRIDGPTLKIVVADTVFANALRQDVDLADSIEVIMDLSDEELIHLYQNAVFCVQSSNFEGFGYPIIEALALGVPTIANDIAIFHEVGHDLPLFVDANDIERLANKISWALDNPNDLGKLTAKIEKKKLPILEKMDATFERLHEVENRAVEHFEYRSTCDATIFVSSYYPDKCGIVDYVDNIATETQSESATFVVVRANANPWVSVKKDYVVCTEKALDTISERWSSKKIFYQLGGGDWQYFMWSLLPLHPGTAVFHDLTMGIGILYNSFANDNGVQFQRMLEAEPRENQRKFWKAVGGSKDLKVWEDAIRTVFDGKLNTYVAKHCSDIIVHDESFRQILINDLKGRVNAQSIQVAPLSKRDIKHKFRNLNRRALQEAHFSGASKFCIGVFGNIVENKQIVDVLKGAMLLMEETDIHIVIVGRAVDKEYYQVVLETAAANSGLLNRISFIDWAQDSEFERLIYLCDVVVNLRYPSNLGMTGPGVQAISAGTPVIVSKEALWTAFGGDTGGVVTSGSKDNVREIYQCLRDVRGRLNKLQTSAYQKYQSTFAMEHLMNFYTPKDTN